MSLRKVPKFLFVLLSLSFSLKGKAQENFLSTPKINVKSLLWSTYFKPAPPNTLKEQIKGLSYLIEQESDSQKLVDLYLKKIFLQMKLIQSYKNATQDKVSPLLSSCLNDTKKVIESPQAAAFQKAMAFFFKAQVLLKQKQTEKATTAFKKSIQLNPQFRMVPYMALFVANKALSKEAFKEASQYYLMAQNIPNSSLKHEIT
ncbi:MAG: hypothetical protein D6797_02175, partial [Bdellovibrio sp.]